MGPVWCYWAFPMERFCGALGHAHLNPRFPFISLDRRVLEVAQLAQIKYIYNLFDTLDLGKHKNAMAKGVRYPNYPHSIFVHPHWVITINNALAKQLGVYLSKMYDVDAQVVERRVRNHNFDVWGKMQQVRDSEGLDMISGYSLLSDTLTPRRDTTFVKVSPFVIILRLFLISRLCSIFLSGIAQSGDSQNTLLMAPSRSVASSISLYSVLR
jgi:hypothetical protein